MSGSGSEGDAGDAAAGSQAPDLARKPTSMMTPEELEARKARKAARALEREAKAKRKAEREARRATKNSSSVSGTPALTSALNSQQNSNAPGPITLSTEEEARIFEEAEKERKARKKAKKAAKKAKEAEEASAGVVAAAEAALSGTSSSTSPPAAAATTANPELDAEAAELQAAAEAAAAADAEYLAEMAAEQAAQQAAAAPVQAAPPQAAPQPAAPTATEAATTAAVPADSQAVAQARSAEEARLAHERQAAQAAADAKAAEEAKAAHERKLAEEAQVAHAAQAARVAADEAAAQQAHQAHSTAHAEASQNHHAETAQHVAEDENAARQAKLAHDLAAAAAEPVVQPAEPVVQPEEPIAHPPPQPADPSLAPATAVAPATTTTDQQLPDVVLSPEEQARIAEEAEKERKARKKAKKAAKRAKEEADRLAAGAAAANGGVVAPVDSVVAEQAPVAAAPPAQAEPVAVATTSAVASSDTVPITADQQTTAQREPVAVTVSASQESQPIVADAEHTHHDAQQPVAAAEPTPAVAAVAPVDELTDEQRQQQELEEKQRLRKAAKAKAAEDAAVAATLTPATDVAIAPSSETVVAVEPAVATDPVASSPPVSHDTHAPAESSPPSHSKQPSHDDNAVHFNPALVANRPAAILLNQSPEGSPIHTHQVSAQPDSPLSSFEPRPTAADFGFLSPVVGFLSPVAKPAHALASPSSLTSSSQRSPQPRKTKAPSADLSTLSEHERAEYLKREAKYEAEQNEIDSSCKLLTTSAHALAFEPQVKKVKAARSVAQETIREDEEELLSPASAGANDEEKSHVSGNEDSSPQRPAPHLRSPSFSRTGSVRGLNGKGEVSFVGNLPLKQSFSLTNDSPVDLCVLIVPESSCFAVSPPYQLPFYMRYHTQVEVNVNLLELPLPSPLDPAIFQLKIRAKRVTESQMGSYDAPQFWSATKRRPYAKKFVKLEYFPSEKQLDRAQKGKELEKKKEIVAAAVYKDEQLSFELLNEEKARRTTEARKAKHLMEMESLARTEADRLRREQQAREEKARMEANTKQWLEKENAARDNAIRQRKDNALARKSPAAPSSTPAPVVLSPLPQTRRGLHSSDNVAVGGGSPVAAGDEESVPTPTLSPRELQDQDKASHHWVAENADAFRPLSPLSQKQTPLWGLAATVNPNAKFDAESEPKFGAASSPSKGTKPKQSPWNYGGSTNQGNNSLSKLRTPGFIFDPLSETDARVEKILKAEEEAKAHADNEARLEREAKDRVDALVRAREEAEYAKLNPNAGVSTSMSDAATDTNEAAAGSELPQHPTDTAVPAIAVTPVKTAGVSHSTQTSFRDPATPPVTFGSTPGQREIETQTSHSVAPSAAPSTRAKSKSVATSKQASKAGTPTALTKKNLAAHDAANSKPSNRSSNVSTPFVEQDTRRTVATSIAGPPTNRPFLPAGSPHISHVTTAREEMKQESHQPPQQHHHIAAAEEFVDPLPPPTQQPYHGLNQSASAPVLVPVATPQRSQRTTSAAATPASATPQRPSTVANAQTPASAGSSRTPMSRTASSVVLSPVIGPKAGKTVGQATLETSWNDVSFIFSKNIRGYMDGIYHLLSSLTSSRSSSGSSSVAPSPGAGLPNPSLAIASDSVLEGLCIPDTICFRSGQPISYYYSGSQGEVREKNWTKISPSKALQRFEPMFLHGKHLEQGYENSIVGTMVVAAPADAGSKIPEYLPYDDVAVMLSSGSISEEAETNGNASGRSSNAGAGNSKKLLEGNLILQQFIRPAGVHHELFKAVWSTAGFSLKRRAHLRTYTDLSVIPSERLVNFDSPPSDSMKEDSIAQGPIYKKLMRLSETIASHITAQCAIHQIRPIKVSFIFQRGYGEVWYLLGVDQINYSNFLSSSSHDDADGLPALSHVPLSPYSQPVSSSGHSTYNLNRSPTVRRTASIDSLAPIVGASAKKGTPVHKRTATNPSGTSSAAAAARAALANTLDLTSSPCVKCHSPASHTIPLHTVLQRWVANIFYADPGELLATLGASAASKNEAWAQRKQVPICESCIGEIHALAISSPKAAYKGSIHPPQVLVALSPKKSAVRSPSTSSMMFLPAAFATNV